MKYFAGCDSGSTYTKCVIIDENGKIVANVTLRSRINAVLSCEESIKQAIEQVPDLKARKTLPTWSEPATDETKFRWQTKT